MDVRNFGKVAVLFGGRSAEREVSLNSGSRVLAAMQRQGVDAHAFDPASRRLDELALFDRAFIALHGRHGEDGTIQGVLEMMGIPYTGSGVMASALGMDKWRSKLLWRAAGLPVPEYVLLDGSSDLAQVEAELGLPLFVKPACEGSSIGITKVLRPGELGAAYAAAAKHDSLVIAERAILGGEYTVAILGDQALPSSRSSPAASFYDYEAQVPARRYRVPLPLRPPRRPRENSFARKPSRPSGSLAAAAGDGLISSWTRSAQPAAARPTFSR
jgi:D-alanine-D-alanine ligase